MKHHLFALLFLSWSSCSLYAEPLPVRDGIITNTTLDLQTYSGSSILWFTFNLSEPNTTNYNLCVMVKMYFLGWHRYGTRRIYCWDWDYQQFNLIIPAGSNFGDTNLHTLTSGEQANASDYYIASYNPI